jgi:hypothetical protein
MKVRELIEQLQRDYALDTELYVEYWDKEIAQSFSSPDIAPLTDEQWSDVVSLMEDSERYDQSLVADALGEAVEKVAVQ